MTENGKVLYPDLLSASDVAKLCGVVPAAVSNWQNRDVGFPEPAMHVSGGRRPLWLRADIEAWNANREPHTTWHKNRPEATREMRSRAAKVLADSGRMSLREIGAVLGVSHEQVRQDLES